MFCRLGNPETRTAIEKKRKKTVCIGDYCPCPTLCFCAIEPNRFTNYEPNFKRPLCFWILGAVFWRHRLGGLTGPPSSCPSVQLPRRLIAAGPLVPPCGPMSSFFLPFMSPPVPASYLSNQFDPHCLPQALAQASTPLEGWPVRRF